MKKTVILLTALIFVLKVSAHFTIESGSVVGAPVEVFDTATDLNFSRTYPFLSMDQANGTMYIWGFNPDSNTAPMTYSATRRQFDPISRLVLEGDENIALNITSNEEPLIAYSSTGYIGVACTDADASNPNALDVVVYSFYNTITNPADVSKVTIVSNSTPGANFLVIQLFFQDDYFYVTYAQLNKNSPDIIYIQGFSTLNPRLTSFPSPVQLNTNTAQEIHQIVCGKQPNNSTIICAWRVETQAKVVYVELDLTTAQVSSETTIVTDSANYEFLPDYIISTDGYFVVILDQVSDGDVKKFSALISNTGETISLPFKLESGYDYANITAASTYYDGFFAIIRSTGDNNTEETLQLLNSDGSANGSAVTILYNGRVLQGLELPDESYWILCIDGVSGNWEKGYIINLFTDTAVFGDLLKPALAFISLLVSLFLVL